jgi:hypothetical protein
MKRQTAADNKKTVEHANGHCDFGDGTSTNSSPAAATGEGIDSSSSVERARSRFSVLHQNLRCRCC